MNNLMSYFFHHNTFKLPQLVIRTKSLWRKQYIHRYEGWRWQMELSLRFTVKWSVPTSRRSLFIITLCDHLVYVVTSFIISAKCFLSIWRTTHSVSYTTKYFHSARSQILFCLQPFHFNINWDRKSAQICCVSLNSRRHRFIPHLQWCHHQWRSVVS